MQYVVRQVQESRVDSYAPRRTVNPQKRGALKFLLFVGNLAPINLQSPLHSYSKRALDHAQLLCFEYTENANNDFNFFLLA